MNDGDMVYLQDIQQRRIPSHGSRVVPLELWGPEGRVECKVKFDVADVAYPVVSLGKMIESGFTFSFDDYKCYMHKDNQRVEIFRKNRIFVLKMRRKWLESKAQMVAPIDEVADEEMEVDDMLEKDQEMQEQNHVQMSQETIHHHRDHERSNTTRSRSCAPTHFDTLSISELVRGVWHQKDGATTITGKRHLMVICKDDGDLSATEVRAKTDEYGVEMVLRFLSTYESVEIKTDGEPSIVEFARRMQARRDKTTTLAQTSVGGHQEIGAVERPNGTVQAQLRAYYLDLQERMKSESHSWHKVVSMDVAVWTVVRYQSDQRTKQTPYERTRGCRYDSALVPFGEVVMAKIADADKMRAGKLDSAWVTAVWVGRVVKSNEHLLLTAKGCIRSRVVRRIPDGN